MPGGGKERAASHPLFTLMHDQPSIVQTSQELREMMQVQVTMRGNAYAQIVRDAGGRVVSLFPLEPTRVEPRLVQNGDNVRIEYAFRPSSGEMLTLRQDQVLHIKGLGNDLLKGLSVVDYARESIGLSMTQEEFTASHFANAATPSAVIQYPGRMSEAAINNLRSSFQKEYSGAAKAGRVIPLEDGVKYEPIKLTNEQSQTLQLREFSVEDVLRWFRVPPHIAGDLRRATFSNIEHMSLEFVMFCMLPWFKRWEQRLNISLLSEGERGTYYFEFLIDGLLRGDTKTRYEAYAIARQQGWLSVDEIRGFENLNPLPDGKGQIYLEPLNMKPVGEKLDEEGSGETL